MAKGAVPSAQGQLPRARGTMSVATVIVIDTTANRFVDSYHRRPMGIPCCVKGVVRCGLSSTATQRRIKRDGH